MAKSDFPGFGDDFVAFLTDLDANNDRDWFKANKKRYEASVLEPTLAFIRAMGPRLSKISPHIVASDKKVGGSMMRIHRDVRFSKDKRPYNAAVKIQFHHTSGKGMTAPGFYLGIEPHQVAFGTGIWHPDNQLLAKIRDHLVANEKAWRKVRDGKAFRDAFGELSGSSLKRVPKGYDKEHPLGDDLKRKDFVGFRHEPSSALTDPAFIDEVTRTYRASKPFCAFLAAAVGVDF